MPFVPFALTFLPISLKDLMNRINSTMERRLLASETILDFLDYLVEPTIILFCPDENKLLL
jgi:hypothetical protein